MCDVHRQKPHCQSVSRLDRERPEARPTSASATRPAAPASRTTAFPTSRPFGSAISTEGWAPTSCPTPSSTAGTASPSLPSSSSNAARDGPKSMTRDDPVDRGARSTVEVPMGDPCPMRRRQSATCRAEHLQNLRETTASTPRTPPPRRMRQPRHRCASRRSRLSRTDPGPSSSGRRNFKRHPPIQGRYATPIPPRAQPVENHIPMKHRWRLARPRPRISCHREAPASYA